jgi:putative phosphoribosyl transferase
MRNLFRDRREAGRLLAEALVAFKDTDTVVLALPRGGVPVAEEVATRLALPLDVIICRKLGVPGHEEYAFGAISEGGVRYIDENIVRSLGLSQNQVAQVQTEEATALKTRIELFRRSTPRRSLVGKTALIIDDGLATGATARAASKAARQLGAGRVVVAVPVGPLGSENSIPEANEVICLSQPATFSAVGRHYESFDQVSDSEVLKILERRNEPI